MSVSSAHGGNTVDRGGHAVAGVGRRFAGLLPELEVRTRAGQSAVESRLQGHRDQRRGEQQYVVQDIQSEHRGRSELLGRCVTGVGYPGGFGRRSAPGSELARAHSICFYEIVYAVSNGPGQYDFFDFFYYYFLYKFHNYLIIFIYKASRILFATSVIEIQKTDKNVFFGD